MRQYGPQRKELMSLTNWVSASMRFSQKGDGAAPFPLKVDDMARRAAKGRAADGWFFVTQGVRAEKMPKCPFRMTKEGEQSLARFLLSPSR